MLKIFVKLVGTGFLCGIGFSIAVALAIFIADEIYSNSYSYVSDAKEDQAAYIKNIVQSIESNGSDQCEDIVGTWIGEFVEDNGTYIRSWELNYEEGGRFWGVMRSKSITDETEEIQEGTWECEHSVLFTEVNIDGRNNKWTYLLLHNEDGERIYATLGKYSVNNVYRAYRKQ